MVKSLSHNPQRPAGERGEVAITSPVEHDAIASVSQHRGRMSRSGVPVTDCPKTMIPPQGLAKTFSNEKKKSETRQERQRTTNEHAKSTCADLTLDR